MDYMHLLYLGVTSAGTDDLPMSSGVSYLTKYSFLTKYSYLTKVLLLNKVFAKDIPACLCKDFSLQSCLGLVSLVLILLP